MHVSFQHVFLPPATKLCVLYTLNYMQRLAVFILALLVAKTFAIESVCNSFTKDKLTDDFPTSTTLNFGIGDNPKDPKETQYSIPLYWGWFISHSEVGTFNTDFYFQVADGAPSMIDVIGSLYVNSAPLMGGRNWSSLNTDYVPTANFECANDNQSFMWGPAYPDFRLDSYDVRAVSPFLETYVHVSAPNTSSYMRYIAFITNKSDKKQKLSVQTAVETDYPFTDVSEFNKGRYVAGYPWLESDPGQIPKNKQTFSAVLTSIHARGAKARDNGFAAYVDNDCWDSGLTYNGHIDAHETKAVMIVFSFATNEVQMLKRASLIDTEPKELFDGLTADQLSQIANWGACEAALGPYVSVAITPLCSSGMTSNVTIDTSIYQRKDFTKPFTHSVVAVIDTNNEFEVVPPQLSSTLVVPNDIGHVRHKLWYGSCLVKETDFFACSNQGDEKQATSKRSVVASEVTQKKSSSSLVQMSTSLLALSALLLRTSTTMRLSIFVVVLLASNAFAYENICKSFTKDKIPTGGLVDFNFGINDSPDGKTMYDVPMEFGWYGSDDFNTNLWLDVSGEMYTMMDSIGPLYINYVPVTGGLNWTQYSSKSYVQTANLECSNEGQTIMWGPSYPDFRRDDYDIRAQYQHLETYIHISAPNTTNYMRYIAFITNKSDKQEKLHIETVNYARDSPLDISPFNDGRYVASFPFGDNDPGADPGDADNFTAILTATHVRGLKARETNVHSYSDMDCWDVGLTYNDKIEAGETKAFMIVYSFAPNKTRMLQSSAWIDTEPKELFDGLNADQISQIVNWGACEAALAPYVSVAITPSCSSGPSSKFTIDTSIYQRKDFTKPFTHRVIGGVIPREIVPPQTSPNLSIPNGIGPIVHQLWYNGCLVKATNLHACPKE